MEFGQLDGREDIVFDPSDSFKYLAKLLAIIVLLPGCL